MQWRSMRSSGWCIEKRGPQNPFLPNGFNLCRGYLRLENSGLRPSSRASLSDSRAIGMSYCRCHSQRLCFLIAIRCSNPGLR